MGQFPMYTEDIFYELMLLGAKPILAHPERNYKIMNNHDLIINLIKQGVLMQTNVGSLLGDYGKDVKKTAQEFVKGNMIHILGSDGHNITSRKTRLKEGYELLKKSNEELYHWILRNEINIINNVTLTDFLELNLKKSKGKFLFSNFFK